MDAYTPKPLPPEPTPFAPEECRFTEPPIPVPEGVTARPGATQGEQVPIQSLQLSRATRLTDLSEQYAWLAPQLLYRNIPLEGRDPLADFAVEFKLPIAPFSIRFRRPLFAGLDCGSDRSWNHVLYGIDRAYWAQFLAFLGSLGFLHRDLNLLIRIRTTQLQIPDPMVLEKAAVLPAPLPLIDVTALCLDTSRGCCYWKPAQFPRLPRVCESYQCYDDTVQLAAALLDEDDNPYSAAQGGASHAGQTALPRGRNRRGRRARS